MDEWVLKRGDVALGVLSNCKSDYPWLFCQFVPTQAFDKVRVLFDEELAILNSGAEGWEVPWEAAYDKIDALGLKLHSCTMDEILDDFILHVEGSEAWFRY